MAVEVSFQSLVWQLSVEVFADR